MSEKQQSFFFGNFPQTTTAQIFVYMGIWMRHKIIAILPSVFAHFYQIAERDLIHVSAFQRELAHVEWGWAKIDGRRAIIKT